MKVAVLFDNFGPYHRARLRESVGVSELLAVQVTKRSANYQWLPEVETTVPSITLSNGDGSPAMYRRQIQQGIDNVLSDFRPEVVFIPGWSSAAAFALLHWCVRHMVPAVAMSESTACDAQRNSFKERIKRKIVELFSAAFVGGQPQANYMRSLGMPSECIFSGYDVVDNDYFMREAQTVRAKIDETRRRYGLPQRYFLASARFIKQKNLFALLQAYAEYRLMCINLLKRPWDLVLLGDGDLRLPLTACRTSLGLEPYVHMPGFKQYRDLPTYYALAEAFVHASISEPWGLVVNEAMASGLPVIVSNRCGCALDLIREGQNGYLFDPNDVDALAKLMVGITAMEQSRLANLGRASQNVIANWGPNRFANGLRHAAECALNNGPIRAGLADRLLLSVLLHR